MAAALCAVSLATGCSNSGGKTAAPATANKPTATVGRAHSDTTRTTRTSNTTGTKSAGVTNRWFPLEPGYQSVRQGSLNRGHTKLEHRRVFTVTNATKVIDGVRAVLVLDQDFDGGEVAEQALDYLALDAQGNVLYLGSYTEAYEGGQFVNAADAWLTGVHGAVRGMLLPGHPQTGTPPYTQADIPGQETSTARVTKTGASVCVPFKCYSDVVVIAEGQELKYFAPGVGGVKTEPNYSGGEQEIEELINLIPLSPQGLAEISAEALRLDEHARETAPDVFGSSQRAEQVS
jgi:hypothetical protein